MASQASRLDTGGDPSSDTSHASLTGLFMTSEETEIAILGASLMEQHLFEARRCQYHIDDADGGPEGHHSQVTIDDSDGPRVEEELNEAINTPFQSPTPSEPDTGLPSHDRSSSSTVSTEPFPDFEASEVVVPSDVYKTLEAVYQYAMSKLAEDIQSQLEMDDSVSAIRESMFSFEEYETQPPSGPSVTILEGVRPCTQASHYNHFCQHHETHKIALRNKIKHILMNNESIPERLRKRFTDISDSVIDMESLLFRSKNFPRDPIRLITVEEITIIRDYATQIVKSLSNLGSLIYREKNKADGIRHLLAAVASQPGLSAPDRFGKMSGLVNHFYDVLFYDDFHVMYNNYLVENISYVPQCLRQTSYLLTNIYNILVQMVQDYQELCKINAEIGKRFLIPARDALSQELPVSSDNLSNTPFVAELEGQPLRQPNRLRVESRETSSPRSRPKANTSPAENETHTHQHAVAQWLSADAFPEAHHVDIHELPRSQRRGLCNECHHSCRMVFLSLPQPVGDYYYLPDHDANSYQEFPSQSSYTIAVQSSSFRDDPFQNVQSVSSFQHSETEYAPTEVISSFDFADYYARANQANPSHSYSTERSQTIDFSDHNVQGTHGLPSDSDGFEHLQGHLNPTQRSEHTQDHSSQSSHNEVHEEPTPEQELELDFDFLDLNDGEDWLPHDHDADHPEAPLDVDHEIQVRMDEASLSLMNLRGACLEAMARGRIHERGDFSNPNLPEPFYPDTTGTSSGDSCRGPFSRPYGSPSEFPQHDAYMTQGRRVGADSPLLPPFPDYGPIVSERDTPPARPLPIRPAQTQPAADSPAMRHSMDRSIGRPAGRHVNHRGNHSQDSSSPSDVI
ncbi:hypothetical protein BDW62DRAFT_204935 [Aspergillus aurantiobrunneus]